MTSVKGVSLFYHREKPSEWAEHDSQRALTTASKKQRRKYIILKLVLYYTVASGLVLVKIQCTELQRIVGN